MIGWWLVGFRPPGVGPFSKGHYGATFRACPEHLRTSAHGTCCSHSRGSHARGASGMKWRREGTRDKEGSPHGMAKALPPRKMIPKKWETKRRNHKKATRYL